MVARLVTGALFQGTTPPLILTLPNPANPAGDLVFILANQNTVGFASATGFSAPYGGLQIGGGTSRATNLYRAADSGVGAAISVAFTGSPTQGYLNGVVFSGVTATEDATQGTATGTSVTTIGTGTVTTVTADTLLIATLATQQAITSPAIDNGFTIVSSSSRTCLAYKVVSATGGQNATWSWTGSASCRGAISAFRIATGIPRGDLAGFIG